nr:hypothetical protein [Tanacetum cinerariifolium]
MNTSSTTVELQAHTPNSTNSPTDPINIASTAGHADEQQKQDDTHHDNDALLNDDNFVILFGTPSTKSIKSSSYLIDNSNMHTFYQNYPSEYKWKKDHILEQVIGDPSKQYMTRKQLNTNLEMCVYALTVSTLEPNNIKESMAISIWIEAMQEELHQSQQLDVSELVDRPAHKQVTNFKWI